MLLFYLLSPDSAAGSAWLRSPRVALLNPFARSKRPLEVITGTQSSSQLLLTALLSLSLLSSGLDSAGNRCRRVILHEAAGGVPRLLEARLPDSETPGGRTGVPSQLFQVTAASVCCFHHCFLFLASKLLGCLGNPCRNACSASGLFD